MNLLVRTAAQRPGDNLAQNEYGPLETPFRQWCAASELVLELLDADQLESARDASLLKESCDQLEKSIAGFSPAALEPEGRLGRLLRQRITTWRQFAALMELQDEAKALENQAVVAFDMSQFRECMDLCDQRAGPKYASVPLSGQIVGLKQRARFWSDAAALSSTLTGKGLYAEKAITLTEFLSRYSQLSALGPDETAELVKLRGQIPRIERLVAEEKFALAGQVVIERFLEDLPADFRTRISQAAGIFRQYPVQLVQERLKTEVAHWVDDIIPDKPGPVEDPDLREVESKTLGVLRGFFDEVKDESGEVIAYRCYPSKNFAAATGSHRLGQLLGIPSQSLPSRCLAQYQEARNRVRKAPNDRQRWRELAGLCESLQEQLDEWLKKPWFHDNQKKQWLADNREFAFTKEAASARQIAADAETWENMDALFAAKPSTQVSDDHEKAASPYPSE